jgi:hypothetical protein
MLISLNPVLISHIIQATFLNLGDCISLSAAQAAQSVLDSLDIYIIYGQSESTLFPDIQSLRHFCVAAITTRVTFCPPIITMPLRCVHNCPKNFETSRKASLTHHQAQCPAYSAQRTAAEHLRVTRFNDKKQRIAARNKLKSKVCHGYQCYCRFQRLIQFFPGSQFA